MNLLSLRLLRILFTCDEKICYLCLTSSLMFYPNNFHTLLLLFKLIFLFHNEQKDPVLIRSNRISKSLKSLNKLIIERKLTIHCIFILSTNQKTGRGWRGKLLRWDKCQVWVALYQTFTNIASFVLLFVLFLFFFYQKNVTTKKDK